MQDYIQEKLIQNKTNRKRLKNFILLSTCKKYYDRIYHRMVECRKAFDSEVDIYKKVCVIQRFYRLRANCIGGNNSENLF